AEIERGAASIRANSVAFDELSGRGVAEGDVVIEDGPDTLEAARVELDIHAFEGVIFEGRLRSEGTGFEAEGARIEKTGTATYRFRDGRFTTCDCPPGTRDPWALCTGEAELEVEGYGTARDVRFEVFDVPVLWVPWLLYPVKVKRQSGLLLPEFGVSSRHGVELGLPVFVAAGDPVNLTLTPRWLQKRGAKGDVEVEWVSGAESEGAVFGSFLHDQDVDAHSASEPFGPDRWVVKGREDVFLPAEARFQSDFYFVSDNQYPTDFEQLGNARTLRFLESNAWLGRDFGSAGLLGLVGSADYADDLQNPDNLDRDEFVLQRLPQLDAVMLPAPLPSFRWLVPSLGARYTRFSQLGSAQGQRPTGVVVGDDLFLDTGIDSLPDAQEPGPAGTGGGVDPS
ncbi:MAG: LPS-assembly protein LptD, partial [Candidatus Rokuibacteriota bacterium]